MDVRVYIAAWRKHNLKVYMNPSCIGEGLHKYFRIPPRVFVSGYKNTRRPFSISFKQ